MSKKLKNVFLLFFLTIYLFEIEFFLVIGFFSFKININFKLFPQFGRHGKNKFKVIQRSQDIANIVSSVSKTIWTVDCLLKYFIHFLKFYENSTSTKCISEILMQFLSKYFRGRDTSKLCIDGPFENSRFVEAFHFRWVNWMGSAVYIITLLLKHFYIAFTCLLFW